MRTFSWKCVMDGERMDSPEPPICRRCGAAMVRDYMSVNLRGRAAFQEHYNFAVGKRVSTSKEFDEALRRGAEEQNTTYTRIDPGDYESITPSGDTQSIEDQNRAQRDRGLVPPSKQTVIPLS